MVKTWIREHINKKRFFCFLFFAALTLVGYQGYLHVKVFLPDHRYFRQGVGLVTIVLCGITLFYFWTMFKGGLLRTIMAPVGRAAQRVYRTLAKRMSNVLAKIRKALGFTEESQRMRGRDEKTFLFHRRKDRTAKAKKLNWKELKDNRERLRFLFVRFVKRQNKKGYRYATAQTPLENGASWRLSEEEGGGFFAAYTDARFADESTAVSDEVLERYAELVGKK